MGWIYWPMLPTPGLLIVAVSEVLLVLRWKMDWDGGSSTKCWNTARHCNFNSKIGLLDVENHLQVVGSFVFLWCFWYQIHSPTYLQPHVIVHGFHGQNWPDSYWFFADWHCGTVALRHQPWWSPLGAPILTTRPKQNGRGSTAFYMAKWEIKRFLPCNDYYEL